MPSSILGVWTTYGCGAYVPSGALESGHDKAACAYPPFSHLAWKPAMYIVPTKGVREPQNPLAEGVGEVIRDDWE